MNIVCAALLVLLALCVLPSAVYARSVPDLSVAGSVSLALTCDGETVAGGEIAVYKTGDIMRDSGDYSFVLSDDFSGSGISLDIDYDSDTELAVLAGALAAYVAGSDITGTAAAVGSDGTVTVDGLSTGLYLIVETQAADGYEAFAPFLVSVPMYDEATATYVYDVDASPKVSLEKAQEAAGDPSPDDDDSTASDGDESSTSDGDDSAASDGDDGTDTGGDDSAASDGDDSTDTGGDDSKASEEDVSTTSDDTSSDTDTGTGTQTGDASRLLLWSALFGIAVLFLLVFAVRKRRANKAGRLS